MPQAAIRIGLLPLALLALGLLLRLAR